VTCQRSKAGSEREEGAVQITRHSTETLGPSDWFTGALYVDPIGAPSYGSPAVDEDER